jgi:cyanate permease
MLALTLARRKHLLVAADSDPDRNGAAAGLALANSIGNLGGLAGPSIVGVIKQATDSFTATLLFLAGAMALGGAIALLFGRTARAGASPSPAIPRAGD